jgi:hypothetical protein
MFHVQSAIPFKVGTFLLPDPSGADTLVVCIKATFTIDKGRLRTAAEQAPLVLADEYYGDPNRTSVKFASDATLPKPASDVVIVGSAVAPGGKPAPEFACSASVGSLRKVARVFGDRVWKKGVMGLVPSAPIPATKIPLIFERAFGGSHTLGNGRLIAEPRNPVGCGLKAQRSRDELAGLPAPNLLLPTAALDEPAEHGVPVAFGFIAPTWEPRRSRGGTYDDKWKEERAPFLPKDFDPRFLQTASEGMVYPGKLQGGELVELINMALPPHGVLRFHLPTCKFQVQVRMGREVATPQLQLDTMLVEPNEQRLCLVWRGTVGCHGRFLEIEQIRLAIDQLQGVDG